MAKSLDSCDLRVALAKAAQALWCLPAYHNVQTLLVGAFFLLERPHTPFLQDPGPEISVVEDPEDFAVSLDATPPLAEAVFVAALLSLGLCQHSLESIDDPGESFFISHVSTRPNAHALMAAQVRWRNILPPPA